MEDSLIPEPHRTYLLELLHALGPASDDFVVAGAQAMKFMVARARATKDIDFLLDVLRLRAEPLELSDQLQRLGYGVVEGSRNFQFEKPIPASQEKIRIEFMAPEEFKRQRDFRVEIQDGVHARACTGGTVAIVESEVHQLAGKLPDGSEFTAALRVTKPHALVMLKLLALDDRYRNIRGPSEARHDREEARTHAADIIAIISAQLEIEAFRKAFDGQFNVYPDLGNRVSAILLEYFQEDVSPGLLVYEEFLVADRPLDRNTRHEVADEVERAYKLMKGLARE
jgi:hypothetical protein